MKLISLAFLKQQHGEEDPEIISISYDLTEFSFFQRSSIREFCNFLSKLIAQRTLPGMRQRVPEKEYVCYAHSRRDGMVCVLIADEEYPLTVAFRLVSKALSEFQPNGAAEMTARFLKEYQDPMKADKMTAIQRDLDETKVVMRQNVDAVLRRGENLDILVAKSTDLCASSKTFYTTARKHNQCCSLM